MNCQAIGRVCGISTEVLTVLYVPAPALLCWIVLPLGYRRSIDGADQTNPDQAQKSRLQLRHNETSSPPPPPPTTTTTTTTPPEHSTLATKTPTARPHCSIAINHHILVFTHVSTLAARRHHEHPRPPAQDHVTGGAGHNTLHAKTIATASAQARCLAYLARLFRPP